MCSRRGWVLVAHAAAALWAAAPAAARERDLQHLILRANEEGLRSDPEQVVRKFARMAHDRFLFFRGTAFLMPRAASAFAPPGSDHVAILGDPHPENVGTFLTGRGVRVVDFNDFDLAGYGLYIDDVRRLGLALWITAEEAGLGNKQRIGVVHHMVQGYAEEMTRLAAGKKGVALRVETAFGGDLPDLLSSVDDDEPMTLGAGQIEDGDADLLARLMTDYPKTLYQAERYRPEMFRVKQAWRHHAGIASLPVRRFRLRLEGPTTTSGDDWIVEVKETPPHRSAIIVEIQRQFQEFPDDDPLLGWAGASGHEFRFRRVSPEQRRIDVERIAKQVRSPRWNKRDLKELAFDLGRLLGRGHGLARGQDGQPGFAVLAAAVSDVDGLRQETTAFVQDAARRLAQDFRDFRQILHEQGPLLGR